MRSSRKPPAASVAVASAIVFGLTPAIHASRADLTAVMKASDAVVAFGPNNLVYANSLIFDLNKNNGLFTAKDVIYSINRIKNDKQSLQKENFRDLTEMQAQDDHTIAFMDFVRDHSPSDEYTQAHEQYRGFVLFHRTQAATSLAMERDIQARFSKFLIGFRLHEHETRAYNSSCGA